MEKENLSINLLTDNKRSNIDILLTWALYIGRLLVIMTETAALIVFLSRFSIDRKLIDFNDNIKKQQAMVNFYKQSEDTYRKTQLKLKVGKTYSASSSAVFTLFEDIMNKTSGQMSYTSLTVTPSSINVTAQAPSADVLSAFVQQLKQNPLITSFSITKVESKQRSSLVSITVSANTKFNK